MSYLITLCRIFVFLNDIPWLPFLFGEGESFSSIGFIRLYINYIYWNVLLILFNKILNKTYKINCIICIQYLYIFMNYKTENYNNE